jgi:hypothetical protein
MGNAQVIAVVVALGIVGCRGKATATECAAMLERYVDLTIAADPELRKYGQAQAQAIREVKKAVKKSEPSYRKVQDQCEREVRRNEYDCAMSAKTPNDWEACID